MLSYGVYCWDVVSERRASTDCIVCESVESSRVAALLTTRKSRPDIVHSGQELVVIRATENSRHILKEHSAWRNFLTLMLHALPLPRLRAFHDRFAEKCAHLLDPGTKFPHVKDGKL